MMIPSVEAAPKLCGQLEGGSVFTKTDAEVEDKLSSQHLQFCCQLASWAKSFMAGPAEEDAVRFRAIGRVSDVRQ
jgi:hypothetical protein